MAQSCYTGLPGSGKSYGVVKYVIIPALEGGRRVATNIPLNLDLLDAKYPGKITIFTTKEILEDDKWFQTKFEPGATIVIDEAWKLWPAGLKANNIVEGHKAFLAEHRHMVGTDGKSTEIVLVTQDLAQIAAYPRGLTETTYRSIKLTAVGRDQNYRIDVFQGVASGPNPPAANRLRQIFGKYDPEVFQYYTSQTMSLSDTHGDEKRTDNRSNIFSSKAFTYGIPALILCLLFVAYLGIKKFSTMYGEQPAEPVSTDMAIPNQPGQPVTIQAPPPPPKHRHFYEGMKASIAWNNGQFPYIQYKIAFENDDSRTVIEPDQLGKMGYRVIGYDPCYVQLTGYGQTLDIFCTPGEDAQEAQPNPIVEL